MRINKPFWLTIIELIIAVTISAMLMSSITLFIWSSMNINTKNEKILSSMNWNIPFDSKLSETIKNIRNEWLLMSWSSFGNYSSWIFLKTDSPNFPITFIWIESSTWYCDSFWQSASATWNVDFLTIKEIISPENHLTTTNYKIDSKKNSIYTSTWMLIIWNWYEWNVFDNTNWLLTQLSSPSAISESALNLFIADTWNDRILAYDKSNSQLSLLWDSKNWFNKPSDIYYSWWELYITNAWNWKIMKISDKFWSWSSLDVNLKFTKDITFNRIDFKFSWFTNLSWASLISDYTFSWITKWASDYITSNNTDTLQYNFSWSTHSWHPWNEYNIEVFNLLNYPSAEWWYLVNIKFYNSWNMVFEDNFPYYVKSDWNLFTTDWNIIETIDTWGMPNTIDSSLNWNDSITDWAWLLSSKLSKTTISKIPLANIEYDYTWDILTIKYLYYKYYDCLKWNHILKEKIYKKYLK